MEKGKFVLVTTEFRGVFAGTLEEYDPDENIAILTECRNCIQWNSMVKGVFGLAATGPNQNCKIGPSVPRIRLLKVTSISECTDKAKNAWESEPWN